MRRTVIEKQWEAGRERGSDWGWEEGSRGDCMKEVMSEIFKDGDILDPQERS